ncbi:hypothetical protein A1O3_08339 [Capronia epimyces CBS 606.96]|uniref:ASX DEUBAD domain-containing protein n=1 Tax=Capronia epimyces CBS 606.96 TaxID=1182542 RepID=W9XIL4_9EURO|nr:uncharacterized protein A1O3_08339 [Capronia epimyces CBS 606.96]EXJ80053.1 hypothetical protein A1O3_08339 [Capronia epimyces CBS 606.96]
MAHPSTRLKRNTGPWSALRILNSTSPIITKDLHAFLVTCISGWNDRFNEDEKSAIINALPAKYRKYKVDESGNLFCPISVDFVLDDPYVKAAICRFKKDISEGCYEKGWQNQARKAMQERRDGKFDTYLQGHTEEMFGAQVEDDSLDVTATEIDSSDGEWARKGPRGSRKDLHVAPRSLGDSTHAAGL